VVRTAKLHVLVPWLLATLVLAVAGACSSNDSNGDVSPAAETATVASVRPPDTDGDGVQDDADRCPGQKEDARWSDGSDGCPDGLADLLKFAASDIKTFWDTQLEDQGVSYVPPDSFSTYNGPIETGCGESVPRNAFYCPVDNDIYMDETLAEDALTGVGDFGPVFILAHEWGHSVQANLGVLNDPRIPGIQRELQADCFAGAYAANADERGLLEQGDLDEAAQSLIAAGDPAGTPWYDPQAHGSAQQRLNAFEAGLQQGVGGCAI
jgi:uncharacterized protein